MTSDVFKFLYELSDAELKMMYRDYLYFQEHAKFPYRSTTGNIVRKIKNEYDVSISLTCILWFFEEIVRKRYEKQRKQGNK
jgi:hypothetical protein